MVTCFVLGYHVKYQFVISLVAFACTVVIVVLKCARKAIGNMGVEHGIPRSAVGDAESMAMLNTLGY